MTNRKVHIHKPTPTLHIPAHEQRAAAHRRHNTALPGIPSSRSRRAHSPQPRTTPRHLATHPAGYR